MSKKKIPPINLQKGSSPKVSKDEIKPNPKWVFSFEFFNQIEYFGLSESDPKWFVSLLEKLRDLGSIDVDSFKSDYTQRNSWRYHPIEWTQPHIPIQRKDLTWLPSDYLNNEDDFPLLQFQISKGLGRVVGFWGVGSNIFYIVLLDPLHNLQPSKSYGYKVDDSSPLSCQYSSLLADIENSLRKKSTNCSECEAFKFLEKIPTKNNSTNFFAVFIDDETNERLKDKDVKYILELGLLCLEEKNDNQ